MKKMLFAALPLLALAVLFTSCGKDEPTTKTKNYKWGCYFVYESSVEDMNIYESFSGRDAIQYIANQTAQELGAYAGEAMCASLEDAKTKANCQDAEKALAAFAEKMANISKQHDLGPVEMNYGYWFSVYATSANAASEQYASEKQTAKIKCYPGRAYPLSASAKDAVDSLVFAGTLEAVKAGEYNTTMSMPIERYTEMNADAMTTAVFEPENTVVFSRATRDICTTKVLTFAADKDNLSVTLKLNKDNAAAMQGIWYALVPATFNVEGNKMVTYFVVPIRIN